MSVEQTFAFVGAGNMAGALIRGLIGTKTVSPDRIIASDPDAQQRERLRSDLGIRVTDDNTRAVSGSDVVVLATKPQVFPQVLPGIATSIKTETLVISIAAGISTKLIELALGPEARVVRAMPNTPALVGAGATAIAPGSHASEHDMAIAETVFGSVGLSVRVPEEQIDAVTGLSGSGPAYVFAMVEALRDAGVREGLSEDVAVTLASQTVFGAARLLLEQDEAPSVLRERVTSPGGTTRAGLDALNDAGFAEAISGAVRAATRRSNELREMAEVAAG